MPGSWRSYTEQERADAVGLALAIGAKQAASKLAIPRRTISSWLQRPSPAIQAAIVASEDVVAARLWQAVEEGASAVLAGMRDPKARLGDKASALRIVVEAHALITGGATSRTESTVTTGPGMTFEEQTQLRDFLDHVIASLDDGRPDDVTAVFRDRNALNQLTELRKDMGYYVLSPEEAAAQIAERSRNAE